MSNDNTGGPAFPIERHLPDSNECYYGMSLRDWFAGMAMQGFSANASDTCLDWDFNMTARLSYEQADKMLEARKKIRT